MIRLLFEVIKEIVALVKAWSKDAPGANHAPATLPAAPPPKPETPEERSDKDVETYQKAVIGGNVDDIMRLHDKLRRAAGIATADTGAADGREDSNRSGR